MSSRGDVYDDVAAGFVDAVSTVPSIMSSWPPAKSIASYPVRARVDERFS